MSRAVLWAAPWRLTQRGHDSATAAFFETLFALSNDYQGMRPTVDFEDERALPGLFLREVYEPALTVRTEIVNVPHWLPLTVAVAEANQPKLTGLRRTLSYRDATLHTRVTYDFAQAGAVRLEFRIVCHAHRPNLALIYGTLTALRQPVDIRIISGIDGRFGNSYGGGLNTAIKTHHCAITDVRQTGDAMVLLAATEARMQRIAIATSMCLQGATRIGFERRYRAAHEILAVRLLPGQPCEFVKYAVATHGPQAAGRSRRLLDRARAGSRADLGVLLSEHANVWKSRWNRANVVIAGDQDTDAAVRYGIFQLQQSMDWTSEVTNVPARGLSSEYHSGHFFFNTEFFKLPYWILTEPSRARALLRFRARTIGAARRHARQSGASGARFPEETDLDGEPASPFALLDIASGQTFHEWSGVETKFLSAAVATGVWWYWNATDDDAFMLSDGLELLVETARFGASVPVEDVDRQLSVTSVMCPDEFHYHVDNSVFTNQAIRTGLRYASSAYLALANRYPEAVGALRKRLGLDERELEIWESVAGRLRAARRLGSGVLEQFDGYGSLPDFVFGEMQDNGLPVLPTALAAAADRLEPMPSKVVKEADVILLHALYPEAYPDDQKLRDLDFYEPRTAFASSLAPSPYGVVAAMLGHPERALRHLRLAARYNLAFSPREDYHNGMHLAAYAGAWQVIVCGFFGLRMTGEDLDIRPRAIPRAWTSVSVPIRWRGAALTLRSDGSAVTVASANRGAAILVRVRTGQSVGVFRLKPGDVLTLPVEAGADEPTYPTSPRSGTA